MASTFSTRPAEPSDCALILAFIRELADYEHLLDEVVATEDILHHWLFVEKRAEVLIALADGVAVGYALFFHNFSTFLGRAGIYLEDLYITKAQRGHGYGKALLRELAKLAVARRCGRLEWACLDWNQPSIDFYLSLNAIPMEGWTVYRLAGDTLTGFAQTDEAAHT